MSLETASTLRYSVRRNGGANQSLQIRLGHLSRLISRSPYARLPFEIIRETSLIPIHETTFPLSLRELEDPWLCEAYIAQLLSLFNLGTVLCEIISRKITLIIVEVLETRNYDTEFQIVADIDHIQLVWTVEEGSSVQMEDDERRAVLVEERVVLDEDSARRSEAERMLERLNLEKLDGFERAELGDCCVCYEELKDGKQEVSRIRCGHVYHISCILNWFERNNSCPLCRRKIDSDI